MRHLSGFTFVVNRQVLTEGLQGGELTCPHPLNPFDHQLQVPCVVKSQC